VKRKGVVETSNRMNQPFMRASPSVFCCSSSLWEMTGKEADIISCEEGWKIRAFEDAEEEASLFPLPSHSPSMFCIESPMME
jgi:hypothetical protein